jgi:hypothetical protein
MPYNLLGDDSGDIRAPPSPSQFENLYSLVNQVLLKVDGEQAKHLALNKHNNMLFPGGAVSNGASAGEYATNVSTNSTTAAYIDPRDWIDLPPSAFNDILQPVTASTPGQRTPRHDETYEFLK